MKQVRWRPTIATATAATAFWKQQNKIVGYKRNLWCVFAQKSKRNIYIYVFKKEKWSERWTIMFHSQKYPVYKAVNKDTIEASNCCSQTLCNNSFAHSNIIVTMNEIIMCPTLKLRQTQNGRRSFMLHAKCWIY